MAYIFSNNGRYKPFKLEFEFLNEETLNAAERATLWWNGIDGNEWSPTYPAVYQGQLQCMAVCVDEGGGSQALGATHSREENITFEFVGGIGSIAFQHQYFNYKDTNMNGTWIFSVNANQGITIEWQAPSGALNTTFKLKAVAQVTEVKI